MKNVIILDNNYNIKFENYLIIILFLVINIKIELDVTFILSIYI